MIAHEITKTIDFGNSQEIVIDEIGRVEMIGGTIRISFFTSHWENANEAAQNRLAISVRSGLDTFVHLIDDLVTARDALLRARKAGRSDVAGVLVTFR